MGDSTNNGKAEERYGYTRSGSFKDSDKYVRTRSGTYVRRESIDSHPSRRESTTMPEFRSVAVQLLFARRNKFMLAKLINNHTKFEHLDAFNNFTCMLKPL
jgi:flagellar hook protein FlgE